MNLLAEARAIKPQLVTDRRHLHANPEVGFHNPGTAAYIKERLASMGIEAWDCGVIDEETNAKYEIAGFGHTPGVTGVVATIGHGGPCILLRADTDALPMQEVRRSKYSSRVPGRMHACGHDAHTAMLLGAARLLKDREDELKGTVKLMFQPGEEWGCGARLMIDDGLMENPRVDAAFALHVDPSAQAGTIGVHPGTVSSSMDTYIVEITGVGGHSSVPQKTVDPVMIATQLYTQLNLMFTREIDAALMTTFTIGAVRAGTVTNIIPEKARLDGNMRSQDQATRDRMCERIPEMIDGIVSAWRGSHVTYDFHTPTTHNDPAFIAELLPVIDGIFGEGARYDSGCMAGSEDFSYLSQSVPAAFLMLGAGRPGWPFVHNPDMRLDENALAQGAALHAQVALTWLAHHAE